MADRPILFSAPMVKALLDGRKTQTRRIIKPQPEPCDHRLWCGQNAPTWKIDGAEMHCSTCGNGMRLARGGEGAAGIPLRFAKGDRLWARETAWYDPKVCAGLEDRGLRCFFEDRLVRFQNGTEGLSPFENTAELLEACKLQVRRPGIHMPRWASRLTLTVSDVRVERLQAISRSDAVAEGIEDVTTEVAPRDKTMRFWKRYRDGALNGYVDCPIGSYASLWTEINGAGSWEANPWIVALTFMVERRNIDACPAT